MKETKSNGLINIETTGKDLGVSFWFIIHSPTTRVPGSLLPWGYNEFR